MCKSLLDNYICLCLVPFLRYSSSNNGVTLKPELGVVQSLESLVAVYCSHSTVTVALISVIKRDIGQKSRFFHTPEFDAPLGGPRR